MVQSNHRLFYSDDIMKRIRKHERDQKSQLGQFFTPLNISQDMVSKLDLQKDSKVLEPGCGEGAFVIPLIDRFLEFHPEKKIEHALDYILNYNIWGVEIDSTAYLSLGKQIYDRYDICQ